MLGALAYGVAFVSLGCRSTTPNSGADSVPPSVASAPPAASSAALSPATPPPAQNPRDVLLPDGTGGIGFDDLLFAPALRKMLVPAGATGVVALVDPDSLAVTTLGSVRSSHGPYQGGHGEGCTSADEGRGFVFAIDRTARTLDIVNPSASAKTTAVVATAPLGASPDYVRWVEATNEIWVTEPDAERIEVFSLPPGDRPKPTHVANIAIKGGPESLLIDGAQKRAFSHLWHGATIAIDLNTRTIVSTWANGCNGSRGIAIDRAKGFLLAGCAEGKATVLDIAHDGKVLGSLAAGAGVDVIGYSESLGHLYLPGAASATMAILALSPTGSLSLLATVKTAPGAHCVAPDDRGQAWVCDPHGGRLLLFKDDGKHAE